MRFMKRAFEALNGDNGFRIKRLSHGRKETTV